MVTRILLTLCAALSAVTLHVLAIESDAERCNACTTVAVRSLPEDAFLARLSKEKVKNHIDMHHRLGADGTRYGGKVIDYRLSELRATELLDDLCEDVFKYTWALYIPPPEAGKSVQSASLWQWQRTENLDQALPDELRASGEELKQRRRELKHYCYKLMEKHEDALTNYLSSSKEHHEGLDEFICQQLVPHCPVASTEHEPAEKDTQSLDDSAAPAAEASVTEEL